MTPFHGLPGGETSGGGSPFRSTEVVAVSRAAAGTPCPRARPEVTYPLVTLIDRSTAGAAASVSRSTRVWNISSTRGAATARKEVTSSTAASTRLGPGAAPPDSSLRTALIPVLPGAAP